MKNDEKHGIYVLRLFCFCRAFRLSRAHVPVGQGLPRDLQALLSAQDRLLPSWRAFRPLEIGQVQLLSPRFPSVCQVKPC